MKDRYVVSEDPEWETDCPSVAVLDLEEAACLVHVYGTVTSDVGVHERELMRARRLADRIARLLNTEGEP